MRHVLGTKFYWVHTGCVRRCVAVLVWLVSHWMRCITVPAEDPRTCTECMPHTRAGSHASKARQKNKVGDFIFEKVIGSHRTA